MSSKLPAEWFSEETPLNRKLTLFSSLSIIVNRIIGSGIFRTPGPIMMAVGSISLFYGAWIIGAVATLLGAFLYAEMVAMMPRSGGPYVFLRAAYPPIVSFLRGWAMFFVSETGAIVAVALFFSETFWSMFSYEALIKVRIAALGLGVIWVLSFLNSRGITLSGRLQNIFGMAKMIALLAIFVIGFKNGIHVEHFDKLGQLSLSWGSLLTVGTALRYSFFAYSGWEGATYVAEEIKNPRKNLPLSLFWGILIIMILYLVINTGYLNVMGKEGLANSRVVAVDAMVKVLGGIGGTMIALIIMTSGFTNLNAQVFVKSRTWYAMARDGLFFKPMAKLHPKFKTPNHAIFLQAAWASVLLMFAMLGERAYETIIDFFSFTSTVFNIMTFVAIWIMRRKYKDVSRPYKAWGYPVTLIIVLVIQVWFLITTIITAFIPSLIGAILTCSGLFYYYGVLKKNT